MGVFMFIINLIHNNILRTFFPVSYTDNSYYTPEMVEQHILYKLGLSESDITDEDNQEAQI